MKVTKIHWIMIGISLVVILFSLVLIGQNSFFFTIGIGVLIGALPFIISIIGDAKQEGEKEEMFLEFARSLVESVKTGTPISKSILNVKNKSFGVLSSHIKKLGNQISMGIPLGMALQTFSKDVNNKTISRALTLIGQAEKAGGDIGEILESVAGAVSMSDKLKKERKAAINTLVVQGYIIFFIFIIIILVMQFKILPMMAGIASVDVGEAGFGGGGGDMDLSGITNAFLYLLMIQGLFSGLTIGKLSEGNIKAGIKHSATLMMVSFLVSSGAILFFG
jgi:flagellar protein FlaJ